MFGLQNFRGSCWVNACLQSFFRIPDIVARYSTLDPAHAINSIDLALLNIWKSKGRSGLQDFFAAVRSTQVADSEKGKVFFLPIGQGIGDSHELFTFLCDKLPFLDQLCRYKIADIRICSNCKDKDIKEDSYIEFDFGINSRRITLSQSINETVQPETIDTFKCEKCNKEGCTRQRVLGSFPKTMVFHKLTPQAIIDYSSVLVMNGIEYTLLAVTCFNGGHWWAYGRENVGTPWFTLNDTHVNQHGPKQFPFAPNMRTLIYYRFEK